MKTALVVIPTYNEALNIERLITDIFSLGGRGATDWKLDILVMDDTSPDGTSDIVKRLITEQYPDRLYLVQGEKQGLGRAIQKAFDAALSHSHDVIMTMDADFSHDPADIPALLAAIDEGADVAAGSRYVEGGMIPGNWPLFFILRTRIATFVARWLGGVNADLAELTTNFRAMRRHVVEKMDHNSVKADGYGIQIFIANAITQGNFKVKEVPITFRNRLEGAPKGRARDVLEFFRIAYHLNPDSPAKQTVRFMTVGASGVLVNLGILFILGHSFSTTSPWISVTAIQASIIWNFIWHNTYTFREYRKEPDAFTPKNILKRFGMFEASQLITQLITVLIYTGLTSIGVFYVVSQLCGIIVAFTVNYYLAHKYIWSTKTKVPARV